jgi:thiamine-phosphate pyrophosphorylase
MKSDDLKKSLKLYAVTDRTWTGENFPCKNLCDAVEKAIRGGATFVQLREKKADENFFYSEAVQIKKICGEKKIPFVINDDVLLAKKIDADGVHVGQGDMALSSARKILGEKKIIGVSCQTVEQAISAEKSGADYLGVGAVFQTSSKNDAEKVSLETLKKICGAVKIPVVAIGGISEENISLLKGKGISGVAVISAIFSKADVENSARKIFLRVTEILD